MVGELLQFCRPADERSTAEGLPEAVICIRQMQDFGGEILMSDGRKNYTGGGIGVGAALGIIFGLLSGASIAFSIAIGAAVGLVIGAGWDSRKKGR